MIIRTAIHQVEAALARQAAVGLIGPRQVGKTTLALTIGSQRPSLYLDLESKADRDKLSDPVLFLKNHANKLVILDEIHRMPEIFQSLRGLIDEGRRTGHRVGRFLILGSASIDLLRQSSESLAGRIEYIELDPLTVLEIEPDETAMNRLWSRGGFPDSYLATSDADSFHLRRSFIRTYLERDVPQFGPRISAEQLERLWTMLAHNQGTLLNASRLAAGLSVSAPTVTNYVSLLVDLLLVRRLQPYYINVGKRLIKSPKTYVRDSGLLHGLLGIQNIIDLAGHPVVGSSWEGFVIETLIAAAPEHTKASFYRTSAGAEVDLVLELGGQTGLWIIEIKRGLTAKPTRGFYEAIKDLAPQKTFVVYSGDDCYPLNSEVQAIGLWAMAEMLRKLTLEK
ncbi:MAG: ATP-binding protein [Legionellaceae bacterium]|nr:ATP-binding protein [Legionellaceae bacterium]